MAVGNVSVEIIELFINQLECNQAAIVCLGLLASKVDSEGSDADLKNSFAALTDANSAMIKQLRVTVQVAKDSSNG